MNLHFPTIYAASNDVVGTITSPGVVVQNVNQTGTFISAIIVFMVVVSGLFSLWQFVTGGLGFITSNGDKGKVQESTQKILMAVLGLVVIGVSFILISVVGRLVFGNNFNILSPQLQTVK